MKDLTTFKNYLLINGSAKASVDTHCEKVQYFFKQYEELTQENLNSFLASKINVWAGTSFNLFINAITHYAKFLKLEIEIPKYHKVDKRVKEYINEKQFQELISQFQMFFVDSKKIETIFRLMFTTGLRPKEVIQLKREDFNFDEKIVKIKNTKTFKDRTVPLSDELCKIIPVIFNQEAEKINAFNFTEKKFEYMFKRINEIIKANNWKLKLGPYSMRSCYCHNLISSGVKLTSLQRTLGHNQISTTLRYLAVSEQDAIEEIRKILNRKNKK